MKIKIDWNALAFALLMIMLVKNAVLNAASYGSMPDKKNASDNSWGIEREP